jgi:alpha-tubulin suppressor-like RCC1 family protein
MALYAWGTDANGELGLGGRDDEDSYNIPQKLPWEESKNMIQAAFGDQVRKC